MRKREGGGEGRGEGEGERLGKRGDVWGKILWDLLGRGCCHALAVFPAGPPLSTHALHLLRTKNSHLLFFVGLSVAYPSKRLGTLQSPCFTLHPGTYTYAHTLHTIVKPAQRVLPNGIACLSHHPRQAVFPREFPLLGFITE